jgi:hypothetical protein
MRSRPRTLISAGLVTGLVLASGVATLLPGTATRAAAQALPPYASCDALLAHYRAELERTAVPYGLGGGGTARLAVAEQAAGGDTAADSAVAAPLPAAAAPTGTNLQEAGVDEPDTAKTVARPALRDLRARPGDRRAPARSPSASGSVPLRGQTWGAELLVDGDRVLVLAPGFEPRAPARRGRAGDGAGSPSRVGPHLGAAVRRRRPGAAAAAGAAGPRRPLPVGPALRRLGPAGHLLVPGRGGVQPLEPYGRPRRRRRWPATASWRAR